MRPGWSRPPAELTSISGAIVVVEIRRRSTQSNEADPEARHRVSKQFGPFLGGSPVISIISIEWEPVRHVWSLAPRKVDSRNYAEDHRSGLRKNGSNEVRTVGMHGHNGIMVDGEARWRWLREFCFYG